MKKLTAMLVAFTMVMTMFAPAVSAAQNVDVSAEVASSGSPPVINYQFALSVNETDGSIVPGDDGTHADTKTQVMPIAGVGLVESSKHFKKYVVVSDPNGIADISKVFEQLRNQTGGAVRPEVEATDITANVAEWTAAINQAYADNLITLTARDDMLDLLRSVKAGYRIFVVDNYLTNHDAPGDYKVYFKVVDNGGAFMENTNGLSLGYLLVEYLSLKAFQTDFTSVNYGSIIVNSRKVVAGDEDWATPLRPTIKNQGNIPVQMKVSASVLTGVLSPHQTILASALSVHLLSIDINSLSTTPQVLTNPIMPCTPTQIDFDITAPLGTSANTYTGTITLEMV